MFILTRPNGKWELTQHPTLIAGPWKVSDIDTWVKYTYSAIRNDHMCQASGCEGQLTLNAVSETVTEGTVRRTSRRVTCSHCGVSLIKVSMPDREKLVFVRSLGGVL